MVTQNASRTREGKQVFFEKKTLKIDTAAELNKCIQQIKLPISFFTYQRLYYELPSNTSTITWQENGKGM